MGCQPQGGVKTMNLLVGLAFGFRGYNTATSPNTLLAMELEEQAVEGVIDGVFTDPQLDVSLKYIAPDLRVNICREAKRDATATQLLFNWVAKMTLACCVVDNFTIIVVCAPQHWKRSRDCARRAGFYDVRQAEFRVAPTEESRYWDKLSWHRCTRGPMWWIPYELFNALLMALPKGVYSWLAKWRP